MILCGKQYERGVLLFFRFLDFARNDKGKARNDKGKDNHIDLAAGAGGGCRWRLQEGG